MKYTSYNDMPIADYQRLVAITAEHYEDETDRNLDVMAVITGKSGEELLRLSIVEYRRMADTMNWVYDRVVPSEPMKHYKIGDTKCVVEVRPEQVSWAQYIDFKNWMANPDEHMAELVCLFLIPQGKTYNEGYSLAELHEQVRNTMPITDALGLLAFFFASLQRSKISTLFCSAAMMKMAKQTEEMKQMQEEAREQIRLLSEEALNTLRTISLPSPIRPKM